MSRSPSFRNLARAIRIARYCEENNISTSEGLQHAAALEESCAAARRASRRDFLAYMGKLVVVGGIGPVAWPLRHVLAGHPPGPAVRVAIIGAGLAGLACGDELNNNGIHATLYDASNRVGGRCFSLAGFFPGQVAERGGEFIDNLHKTLLGYAKRFNLAVEDVEKEPPGEVFYFFNAQHFPESAVVDEFRHLVAAMRDDLRTVGQLTADSHTARIELRSSPVHWPILIRSYLWSPKTVEKRISMRQVIRRFLERPVAWVRTPCVTRLPLCC
jgi:monoamine oxidase